MNGGVRIPGLSRRLRTTVYDHVFDNDTHEVGGVLVGSLGDDDMPVVTGAIAALEARGERASVTFTHDAWSSIHARMETDFPQQQIVGWYHSHPGFGIFLSGHDMFIQENFFSDKRQIAYVIDPHAGTEGVFGWRGGKVELIEEGPAGRPGTGGRANRQAGETTADWMRWGGLAAVLAVFVAVGAALVLGGGSEPDAASPQRLPGGAAGSVPIVRLMQSNALRLAPPAPPSLVDPGTKTPPPPSPADPRFDASQSAPLKHK